MTKEVKNILKSIITSGTKFATGATLIALLLTGNVDAAQNDSKQTNSICKPYQIKDNKNNCITDIKKLGKYLHIRFDCEDDICTGQRVEGISPELNMPNVCKLTDTVKGTDTPHTRKQTDYYDCNIGTIIAIETWNKSR